MTLAIGWWGFRLDWADSKGLKTGTGRGSSSLSLEERWLG